MRFGSLGTSCGTSWSLRRGVGAVAVLAVALVVATVPSRAGAQSAPPPESAPPVTASEPTIEAETDPATTELAPTKRRRRRGIEIDDEPSHRHLFVAWLPLELLLPMVAFSAEVRLADEVSVSAFGGYGSVPIVVPGGAPSEHRTAWQLGAQLHYYVSGTFELGGIHVGGDVRFTRVADADQRVKTFAVTPGFVVGPFVRFKIATRSGFTFDSQIGIGYAAGGGGGARRNDDEQKFVLTGNVAVGWTF